MQQGTFQDLRCWQIPWVEDICAFVQATDCAGLAPGEIAIKGRDLFVRVGEYVTAPQASKRFETHRLYADVQYLVQGVEVMGIATQGPLLPLVDYDELQDIQFFQTPKYVENLIVSSGDFVLFLPGEAHQPGCLYQSSVKVKKLVFKVKMQHAIT